MTKTCPSCGARVGESALTCPRCHASLDVTQRMTPLAEASWCPSCGALVAPGETVCPKCGSALAAPSAPRARRNLDLPEIGGTGELFGEEPEDAEKTGVMTRIESAIPSADDESSPFASKDRMPKTRSLLLAALFAVALVGGAALLITHPWDPSASQTRAKTPADTSQSGFPGVVDKLTGQDASGDEGGAEGEGELTPEEALASDYASLSELAGRVDESEQALRELCESGDASAAADGLAQAQENAIQVSNLISEIELLQGDEDADNLLTLGSWLRNRCDALSAAWEEAASTSDLAGSEGTILAGADTSAEYGHLFDESYDAWDPSA